MRWYIAFYNSARNFKQILSLYYTVDFIDAVITMWPQASRHRAIGAINSYAYVYSCGGAKNWQQGYAKNPHWSGWFLD